MISNEKNSGGPTSGCGLDQDFCTRLALWRPLQVLVCILDHDDGRIDHRPNGNGDAAEAHDVGRDAERPHAGVSNEDAERQRDDGDERAARMQQEHETNERDDQAFLDQRGHERGNRTIDEIGPIVDGNDRGALGQAALDVGDAVLDVGDDGKRVLPVALHRDAGDDLALAVELRHTAALVGRHFNARHILYQDGGSAFCFEHDQFNVGDAFQIAAPAHHELGFGQFHHAAADIHVGLADRVANFGQGDVERTQPAGIDDDRVLPHESADARHLGNAFGLGNGKPNLPILRRAQLGECALFRHDRVLVDPADTCRIGPQ